MHTTALSYGASGGRPFTTPAFHKVLGKHRGDSHVETALTETSHLTHYGANGGEATVHRFTPNVTSGKISPVRRPPIFLFYSMRFLSIPFPP